MAHCSVNLTTVSIDVLFAILPYGSGPCVSPR